MPSLQSNTTAQMERSSSGVPQKLRITLAKPLPLAGKHYASARPFSHPPQPRLQKHQEAQGDMERKEDKHESSKRREAAPTSRDHHSGVPGGKILITASSRQAWTADTSHRAGTISTGQQQGGVGPKENGWQSGDSPRSGKRHRSGVINDDRQERKIAKLEPPSRSSHLQDPPDPKQTFRNGTATHLPSSLTTKLERSRPQPTPPNGVHRSGSMWPPRGGHDDQAKVGTTGDGAEPVEQSSVSRHSEDLSAARSQPAVPGTEPPLDTAAHSSRVRWEYAERRLDRRRAKKAEAEQAMAAAAAAATLPPPPSYIHIRGELPPEGEAYSRLAAVALRPAPPLVPQSQAPQGERERERERESLVQHGTALKHRADGLNRVAGGGATTWTMQSVGLYVRSALAFMQVGASQQTPQRRDKCLWRMTAQMLRFAGEGLREVELAPAAARDGLSALLERLQALCLLRHMAAQQALLRSAATALAARAQVVAAASRAGGRPSSSSSAATLPSASRQTQKPGPQQQGPSPGGDSAKSSQDIFALPATAGGTSTSGVGVGTERTAAAATPSRPGGEWVVDALMAAELMAKSAADLSAFATAQGGPAGGDAGRLAAVHMATMGLDAGMYGVAHLVGHAERALYYIEQLSTEP